MQDLILVEDVFGFILITHHFALNLVIHADNHIFGEKEVGVKYLWTCLVGICTLGMMGCGEDSTGANQSGEIWVADLGEKGGMSNTWRLDFTKEPQLLAGQYAGGTIFFGVLGTYAFNEDGLLIATDACVDEYGQSPSKDQCEGLGELEQFPIFKTETGYILVRNTTIYEGSESGDGVVTDQNDTIPFKKQ